MVETLRVRDGVRIDSWLTEADERSLANDVLDGLTRPFKEIPPKHFYDSRGSELFERITELPEYYPTRTERSILTTHAAEMVGDAGDLVELGAGSPDKARILLAAMDEPQRYIPVDVSAEIVADAAPALVDDHPGLRVHAVIGDIERHLGHVPDTEDSGRVVALLGGTIGNFLPGSRRRMLRAIAGLLGPGDRLLLGTDLVKDSAVLEAAYNDPQGVTAQFNRNVLHVINRELGADFLPDGFEHVAFFEPRHEWIEMRLRAMRPMSVAVRDLGLRVEFAAGEELRTEISQKFTRARLEADFAAAGLVLDEWFVDAREFFALSLARLRD